jgi:hypothetical protein
MANESEYKPIIIQEGNRFCVYLPEKKISGEGESLDDAYNEYLANLRNNETLSKKYGLATISQEPYPSIRYREIVRELIIFWLKICSASAIIILTLVLFLPNIRAAVEHQVSASYRYWALELPQELNNKFDRLKPEEEFQMSVEWRKLLERAREIVVDEKDEK